MIFDAAGLSYIVSSHEGVPDDDTRSILVNACTSSYAYSGGGATDYDESGLADRFFNIVYATNQPLWEGCNQSHLIVIAELVDFKAPACLRARPTPEKSPYAVLRYLSLTPAYRGSILRGHCRAHDVACHTLDSKSRVMFGWAFAQWFGTARFLKMVIPSPSNSKRLINLYLEPLIEELLQLWHVGVRMYDHATVRAFMIRAALMWTVNDLPAYRMASRWSTRGVMGCPVCMDDTRVFHLQHGRKACYFDCHRQFLPAYHRYRRNKKAFTNNRVENKIARPRASGATKKRWLNGPKRHIIESYILTNCEVVTPYYNAEVTSFPAYFVNGYNFQTECHNTVATDNQSYDLRDPNNLQVVLEAAGTSQRQLHEYDDENEDEDEDNDEDDETDDQEYKTT
ncbi:UNVERIFIED_CONTAM: hypothetical protein Scaly_1024000 [Sesamum calycinum]|uniref:Uncharacterized protein n=1 Tax=Sesamum calycinum TaxID=2727403 RepID=A0AAW2QKA8_9LAMI